jgi:hypothetical protein
MAGSSILALIADLKELGLKDLKYGGGGISGQAYFGDSKEVGRLPGELVVLIVSEKLVVIECWQSGALFSGGHSNMIWTLARQGRYIPYVYRPLTRLPFC